MQKFALAAAMAAVLASASAALAESRSLNVDTFTGVEVTSGITADIAVGGPLSVVAESPNAKDIDELRYDVRDGVLHVWYDWNVFQIFDPGHSLKLTITVPTLESIESTSGASVDAMGLAAGDIRLAATSGAHLSAAGLTGTKYRVEVTSGASAQFSGACESIEAEITTGSSLTAKDLTCVDAWAEVTTGASATLTATGTIGGEVTTGASLTVYGSPEVKHLETTTGGSTNFPG